MLAWVHPGRHDRDWNMEKDGEPEGEYSDSSSSSERKEEVLDVGLVAPHSGELGVAKKRGSFQCKHPGCGKVFPKLFKLDRHMRTHDKKRPFPCDWPGCERAFSRKDHLKRHMTLHTNPDARNFKCRYAGCNHAFTSNQKLRRHVLSHEKPFPHACTFENCTERFAKKSQLRNHQSTHEGLLPYVCDAKDCKSAFKSSKELRKHKNITHREKRYACTVEGCGLRFIRFTEFRRHQRQEHPELSAFPCPECGNIFTQKHKLNSHLLIHTTRLKCEFDGCGREFSKAYNLRTHVNMVHLKLRPFVCSHKDCDKSFSTKGSLKRHVQKMHDSKRVVEAQKLKRKRVLDKICGTGQQAHPDSSSTSKAIVDDLPTLAASKQKKPRLSVDHQEVESGVGNSDGKTQTLTEDLGCWVPVV